MSSLKSVRANRKFSQEEDIKLRCVVSKLGTHSWKSVASFMPGRNVRQCRERWNKFLSPSVNLSPFTREEDVRLLGLYKELGPQWVKIGKHLGNRSDIAIKARFMLLERHRKKREMSEESSSSCEDNVSESSVSEAPIHNHVKPNRQISAGITSKELNNEIDSLFFSDFTDFFDFNEVFGVEQL
ncbi:Myb-like DNA-binding domain containing protein [Trichomonas vaginalis G3]|uniref:Myb-like DNA-binding domain containing protein n=1 Tax=Trichomonas vaginalis (strain ATCC PRA-98 / G3) TaxID=412133 RepID=A2DGH6_TRIV3|nr:RNA polymerase II transcription regulator recruiting protein [Trichomonas vaginalis G3]EAY20572.1 Myb-like DNA-binding domain containing protein [Trichomonas vaginalis G3]KAI5488233.1 RNA polymerase II transcription regulator recruiting protein [Trichomonas vaginalis G3]|eukprot:XP_001581558.1 Myb-like DNA-binding domain containing protein [Trichomonas vaginalis G3]